MVTAEFDSDVDAAASPHRIMGVLFEEARGRQAISVKVEGQPIASAQDQAHVVRALVTIPPDAPPGTAWDNGRLYWAVALFRGDKPIALDTIVVHTPREAPPEPVTLKPDVLADNFEGGILGGSIRVKELMRPPFGRFGLSMYAALQRRNLRAVAVALVIIIEALALGSVFAVAVEVEFQPQWLVVISVMLWVTAVLGVQSHGVRRALFGTLVFGPLALATVFPEDFGVASRSTLVLLAGALAVVMAVRVAEPYSGIVRTASLIVTVFLAGVGLPLLFLGILAWAIGVNPTGVLSALGILAALLLAFQAASWWGRQH